jgi:hypothetical protein
MACSEDGGANSEADAEVVAEAASDTRPVVDANFVRDVRGDAGDVDREAASGDAQDAMQPNVDAAPDATVDATPEREGSRDAGADADAASCTRPTRDAGSEAGKSTANLTGFAASEVAYVTMRDRPGGIPTDRHLELVFSETPGACGRALLGEEKARSKRLVIDILRTDFDHLDMLPDFFVPGTYPFHENVYMRDGGFMISLADADLVETDDACKATYTRASTGSVTLVRIDPAHVTGSFTAAFEDGGMVSGDFDADVCLDVELPLCGTSCVP